MTSCVTSGFGAHGAMVGLGPYQGASLISRSDCGSKFLGVLRIQALQDPRTERAEQARVRPRLVGAELRAHSQISQSGHPEPAIQACIGATPLLGSRTRSSIDPVHQCWTQIEVH